MVVFDSSIVVDVMKKNKAARALIESHTENGRIAITIVTKYEILRGTDKEDLNLVSKWLNQFIVYDFDDHAIAEVVKAYKKLKEHGNLINEFDMIIAGIATANGETLITKDRDFLKFNDPKIKVI
jgi:predicted nucleic acid-binding protein